MLHVCHCRPFRARAQRLAKFVLAAAVLSALLCAGRSLAQEKGAATAKPNPARPATGPARPPMPATAPAATAPTELQGEVKPEEVLHVRDKDGNLVPVLGFTYEDFIELTKLKNQLNQQEQKPRYHFKNIALTGTANGDRAELVAEFTIVTDDTQWIRVPLRLGSTVLRQEAKFDGSGEYFLHRDEDSDGYVCWIHSEPKKTHVVSLKVLAQLANVGGERQLKLSVPRATISQIKLDVDTDRAVARVSDGSELINPKGLPGARTELLVWGVGGDFELGWRAADSQVASVPTVLEASGALLERIDGRSVKTEAKITVRSFGGSFDQFRMRLPAGAVLVGPKQPGVLIVPVPAAAAAGKPGAAGELIELKLEKKTPGPIDINLVTERPYNIAQADELLELAGFEVLGAVRQWGHIAVQVEGNWQIAWGEMRNVRQVDDLPEALRRDDLAAGFEYFVQPCSLTARVVPQKTRISVQPEYQYLVTAQQVQLEARLKYTVRGAKVRKLNLEVPGWEIESLGPDNLVDLKFDTDNDEPTFTIPLAHPTSGEFELIVKAHRPIAGDAKSLEFDLPRPEAETLGQASVIVAPADNVELAPTLDAMRALVPQPLKARSTLPQSQQDRLSFRAENSMAHFAAAFKVHAQSIATNVETQLEVDQSEIRVEQRLSFQVSYEPVDKLTILVPHTISRERLKVSLDGQQLVPVIVHDDAGADPLAVIEMRVPLPTPRIGRCGLQVNFSIPQERLMPALSVPLVVPLVMPGEGTLVRNQLVISDKPGIAVTPRKGPWTLDEQSRRLLVSKVAASEVALAVTLKERASEGSTIVERGWIQTWLSHSARQDRVLYRITTSDHRLRMTLPAGINPTEAEFFIDGSRVVADADPQGDALLTLPSLGASREFLLEVRYQFKTRPHSGSLAFTAPQLKPAVWLRRVYWQVILPPNEHLILSPAQFVSEFTWSWQGLYWQRQPAMEQADLEAWLGTPATTPVPAATNRYLFSTVAASGSLTIWSAGRSIIVLVSSLVLLSAGLALIYFPVLRHPAVLFVPAVLLLALALVQPESALLVAQASALGMSLLVLSLLLARKTLKRPVPRPPSRGSSHGLDRSATELFHRQARSNSPSSTATSPMAMQASSPDVPL